MSDYNSIFKKINPFIYKIWMRSDASSPVVGNIMYAMRYRPQWLWLLPSMYLSARRHHFLNSHCFHRIFFIERRFSRTFFCFLEGGMRQLWQTSGWLLQFTPICYNNSGWNIEKKLEWTEFRPNFASEIRNDIALWIIDTHKIKGWKSALWTLTISVYAPTEIEKGKTTKKELNHI